MKLTIIIPVFNEENTVRKILEKIAALNILGIGKEVIVINDGSTDNTLWEIKKFIEKTKFPAIILSHEKNKGKGAAVILGIRKAKGTHIIIQDADLEYNPQDICKLIHVVRSKAGEVVFGTRLKRLPHLRGEERSIRFVAHYFGNRMLSLITSILYGQWITDMETCYKLFPKNAVNGIVLRAKGFEFEPEITAKLLKQKLKIVEIPITATPRGYKDGKKLKTLQDGIKAIKTLVVYRFTD